VYLGIFLAVPFFIEAVFPEWALSRVSLVFTLTVGAPEGIGAVFTLLCFESGRVNSVICLIALCKFSMVDSLMWAITSDAFCPLDSAYACRVTPFPAIFALENTWIHVCASDGGDESSYVEPSVNKGFSFGAALSIPNINLYYGHVRLQRNLDYSGF